MVRPGPYCAILVLLGVAVCGGESGAPQRNQGPTSPSSLLVLPGAEDVKTTNRNEVTYKLQEAWPAENTIASIGRQLAAEGWQRSETYLLGSGTAPLRMWTTYIVGHETVFGWWAQWNHPDGSVVIYALRYKVPGVTDNARPAGPLYVEARFFSRVTAEMLRNAN